MKKREVSELNDRLLDSAEYGETEDVLKLLAEGADIEARDDREGGAGWTALNYAAWGGHSECLKALIASGADINVQDGEGWTPLHSAAGNGRPGCVKLLLEAGADIDCTDDAKITPFFYAAQNGINGWTDTDDKGYMECLKLLAAAGADINTTDNCGNTALHISIQRTDFECMSLLMELGADINANANNSRCGRYEWSPLHCAMFNNNTEAVRILLDAGADPNFRDNMGHTALMIAACSGNTCDVEITKLLVKYGADLTLCSDSGEDCAHLASSCGRFRVLKLFLEYGMDINSLDKHGFTGIMRAAQKIDLDTVEKLIEMGADLNVKTKRGEDLSSIIARYHGLRQKKILDVIAGVNRLKAEDTRNAPDTGYEFDV